MTIEYTESEPFKKDFKKLFKRFHTLHEDFKSAKKSAIELFHILGIDNHSIIHLTDYNDGDMRIYKLRKFACKALKGRGAQSDIRIIYAFHETKKRVVFIEMYFKADQESECGKRIAEWLKNNLFQGGIK